MQRFALFPGLIALTVTLGVLWQSEESQPPLSVADLNVELPPHVQELLSEMPPDEAAELIRKLREREEKAWKIRKLRVIDLSQRPYEHHPFLFPTDQMYQQFSERDLRRR